MNEELFNDAQEGIRPSKLSIKHSSIIQKASILARSGKKDTSKK